MPVTLKDDFAKEQKQWVKRAMKGRPLYFGLQAQAAKKGKFVVSKKPGEVKPAKVKDLELYEGSGKDKAKADDKNKVPGGASMGVCQGANGTLKLYFERGKALPVAEKFVKFFVTREVKFKLVKKVLIAEVDTLPTVPEQDAGDSEQVTAQSVEARVKELAQRSKAAGGDEYRLPDRLKLALGLARSNPGQADDALDEIEFVIGTLERAKALQDRLTATAKEPGVAKEPVAAIARRILEARNQIKAEDIDGADENLDVVEQSIANLRTAAGLPEAGGVSPQPVQREDKARQLFKQWLNELPPKLKELQNRQSAELPEIQKLAKYVQDAVQSGEPQEWPTVRENQTRADALITKALEAPATGMVALRTIGVEWRTARNEVFSRLKLIEDVMRNSKARNARPAAEVISELTGAFPDELDDLTTQLEAAVKQGDARQIAALKEDIRDSVEDYAILLKDNEEILTVIEQNPINIQFSALAPLRRALTSIARAIA